MRPTPHATSRKYAGGAEPDPAGSAGIRRLVQRVGLGERAPNGDGTLTGEPVLVLWRPTPSAIGIFDQSGRRLGAVVNHDPIRQVRGETKHVWNVLDPGGRCLLTIEGGPGRAWIVRGPDHQLIAIVEKSRRERRAHDVAGNLLAVMRDGQLWTESGDEVARVTSSARGRVVSIAPEADRTLRRVAIALAAVRAPVADGLTQSPIDPGDPWAGARSRRLTSVAWVAVFLTVAMCILAVSSGNHGPVRKPVVFSLPALSTTPAPLTLPVTLPVTLPGPPPNPNCDTGCEAAAKLLVPIPGFAYRNYTYVPGGSSVAVTVSGAGLNRSISAAGAFLFLDQTLASRLQCDVAGVTLNGSRVVSGATVYTGLTNEFDSSYCFGLGPFRVIIWGNPPTSIEQFITAFVAANAQLAPQ